MTVWYITLASTFIICIIARINGKYYIENGIQRVKPNKFFALVACMILICVSGLRYGIGDTLAYVDSFDRLSLSDLFSSLNSKGKCPGYDFLAVLVKKYISDDAQVWIFILALLTLGIIYLQFYNMVNYLELAVFLFITTGCYLVSMNGLRQYLVTAVLFAATPLILKRKWYIYFPIIILCYTVHTSSLIFIPLYFIVNKPAWGRTTKLILMAGLLLYITYPVSGPIVAKLLQESQYGEYSNVIASTSGGANMIRVLVMAVPMVLSYIGKEFIRGKEKYFDIMVNFTVVNWVAILLATKYWIYARFNMYFLVYSIVLLVWCLQYLWNGINQKIMYFLTVLFYTIYYWYEMVISLSQPYVSHILTF